MRIRKNKLSTPDIEYVTILKGKWAMIKLYHLPEYCVQIVTEKDNQCYPLTSEQYNNYYDNAMLTLQPSRTLLEISITEAEHAVVIANDKNTAKFWTEVREHFMRRLEHE